MATVPPFQELAPVTTAIVPSQLSYLFIYLDLVAYLTGSLPTCESRNRLSCSGLVESAQIIEVSMCILMPIFIVRMYIVPMFMGANYLQYYKL